MIDINATDADPPNEAAGSISYSLLSAPFPQPLGVTDCTTIMCIDSATGTITVSSDLETSASTFSECVLTVKAEDNAIKRRSSTTAITVVLLPVPVIETPENIQMVENLVEGSVIANPSCSEIGPSSGHLSVSLQGVFTRYFHFDVDQGALSIARTFDFETLPDSSRPFYEIEIVCENQHRLTDVREITIVVINVDDNPFLFENSTYSVSIPENFTVQQAILEVDAYDADFPEGTLEFFFSNNSQYFAINSSTGVVVVTAPLDRESQDQHLFEVRARLHETGQVISALLNVTITDVNDEVPMFVPQFYIIYNLTTLNDIGDYVVTILALDPDLNEGGEVTYQLEENNFFILNETSGLLFVNSVLQPNQRLNLTINAMDKGNPQLSSDTTIDFFVHPSPDRVRFSNSHYLFMVPEDEPRGSLIGRVEAFVVDDSNMTNEQLQAIYTISMQSSFPTFSIRNTTGEIYLIADLDYELSAHQHGLSIQASYRVTSDILLTSETVVLIDVININDNPPLFTPGFYATTVEEFTPAGTSIMTVSAVDEESDIIFFSLEGDDSNPFMINSQSGVISAKNNLTIAQDYRFHVIASDGELRSQAVVHISVSRQVSVKPTFTKEQYIFNISENVHSSNMTQIDVGRVEALSFGRRYSHEFSSIKFRIGMSNGSMISESEPPLFEVNETTGVIYIIDPLRLDAESRITYIFHVEVYNSTDEAAFDMTTVEIRVDDANDNSPSFNQSLYTRVINSSLSFGSTVLTVSAYDYDSSSNSELTYSLLSTTLGFSVNSTSGELTAENTTLIPGTYHLIVVATDKGFPSQIGSVSAFITVISTEPRGVEFTQSAYIFQVSEDVLVGYLIGFVVSETIQSNVPQDIVFYSTPPLNICITIDSTSGQIQVSCTLDRELQSSYELAVTAIAGEYIGNCKVVINVVDINDNAPLFLLDEYAKVVNSKHGTILPIIQVQATDLDYGDNGNVTYSLLSVTGANTSDTDTYFVLDEITGHIFSQESTLPVGDYLLLVQGSDPGALNSTVKVWIYVTEVRPPVVFFDSTPLTVSENLNSRSLVGHVTLIASGSVVNPQDYHGYLLFGITGGDTLSDVANVTGIFHPDLDSYLFEVNSHTGAIYTRISLDREAASSHIVTVRAAFFTYGISVETSLPVYVTDINDVTPEFQPSSYFGMANNTLQTGAVVVATVTAVDLDIGNNSEVHFEIDSSVPFGIHMTTAKYPYTSGEIYVTNSSEFMFRSYSFGIYAIDGGSIPLTSTAQVLIVIDYEPPDSISFTQDVYQFEVTENSPQGTIVGNVSVGQMGPALDELVYSIHQGTENSFTINATSGTITTISIDREALPHANLTVIAFLPSAPSLEQAETTINIFIEDVNDNHPIFSQDSYLAVFLTTEIPDNEKLTQVEATDLDYGSNAQILFSIEDISPEAYANDFYITQNGSIHTNNTNLSAGAYNLTVSAQDMGTPSLVSSATVSNQNTTSCS